MYGPIFWQNLRSILIEADGYGIPVFSFVSHAKNTKQAASTAARPHQPGQSRFPPLPPRHHHGRGQGESCVACCSP